MQYLEIANALFGVVASIVAILTYLNVRVARKDIDRARSEIAETKTAIKKEGLSIVFPHSKNAAIPVAAFLKEWISFIDGPDSLDARLKRGAQKNAFSKHTQPRSLDALCRKLVAKRGVGSLDTMQASQKFLDANPGVFVTVVDRPHTVELAQWVKVLASDDR